MTGFSEKRWFPIAAEKILNGIYILGGVANRHAIASMIQFNWPKMTPVPYAKVLSNLNSNTTDCEFLMKSPNHVWHVDKDIFLAYAPHAKRRKVTTMRFKM